MHISYQKPFRIQQTVYRVLDKESEETRDSSHARSDLDRIGGARLSLSRAGRGRGRRATDSAGFRRAGDLTGQHSGADG